MRLRLRVGPRLQGHRGAALSPLAEQSEYFCLIQRALIHTEELLEEEESGALVLARDFRPGDSCCELLHRSRTFLRVRRPLLSPSDPALSTSSFCRVRLASRLSEVSFSSDVPSSSLGRLLESPRSSELSHR
jgi:hypothetical protein